MNIHQELQFNAPTEQVFELLINAEKFASLTSAEALIESKMGGQFSIFGGMIKGMTIELVQNELIVQAWRPENWTKGVYSIARFEFQKISNHSTKLIFDHSGFPTEFKHHLSEGWKQRYWAPMRKLLG